MVSFSALFLRKTCYFCTKIDQQGLMLVKVSLGAIATTGQRSFAIAAAPSLYLLESREHRQQTIYEAWLIIDNAAAARVATSYTRFKALVSIMPAMATATTGDRSLLGEIEVP